MAEIIYATYERCLEKLNSCSMKVYHFFQSRIEYYNGKLNKNDVNNIIELWHNMDIKRDI